MQLETLDIVIVGLYAIFIITIAQWVSREKDDHKKNAEDYFLASKSLPWWAIGASLIAANISAEQIIGMSGSGYAVGLAIASYEWMSALTLILVGKYFLPIFLKQRIYTMPQYLEQRYNHTVRIVMAIFWIALYVFVNLAAILWLGALAINTIAGVDIVYGLVILGFLSAAYSLYGGLKAVALTDIIQVVLLILGGFIVTWLSLDKISDGAGAIQGFIQLSSMLPEKFDLILSPDNPNYINLPGLSVLIGGMWIMNISYWGCNQYIIQRALAAKSTRDAQKGIILAAGLKLLIPFFVVIPGIAAVVLSPELTSPDQAYPEMMNLVPAGIKGLVFAALIAAILSSVGSMMNSIATIFTMDIYRHFAPNTNDDQLLKIGRIVALLAVIIAMLTARPLLGQFDQAFQYIQEFTGFFTPGIVVLFLLGLFWKRTTTNGALAAALGSFILSASFRYWWPSLPFMDRVSLVFILCTLLAIAISLKSKPRENINSVDSAVIMDSVELDKVDFTTSSRFNIASIVIILILVTFYSVWW